MSNMSRIPSFVTQVVQDGRYDIENFKKAQGALRKHREYGHIEKCKTLIEKLKEAQDSQADEDDIENQLGDDFPPDFLDPIGYCLM